MVTHPVIVIGAGPAGITAAIQLKRSGVEPILLERGTPGGLLLNANLVENYPGFPAGITGSELARAMVRHLERVGVAITPADVRCIDHSGEDFRVTLRAGGDPIRAPVVILATGTRGIVPDDLPIPPRLMGRRIFCEVRDCPAGEGDRVGIIGGGDCAFDYALNLAGKGSRVTILHRGARPIALGLLVDRARDLAGIEYVAGAVIKDIDRDSSGIRLRMALPDPGFRQVQHLAGPGCPASFAGEAQKILEVDYLLLAVGRVPEDGILSPEIRLALGRGIAIEGLYPAGDVHRGLMRQVGIAVGDGLMAAMEISRRLTGIGEGCQDRLEFADDGSREGTRREQDF